MYTYTELHCHSFYSLLNGTSLPEDLLDRAAFLDMGALALTDHDGLYGAVRFYQAARERGIKPILGAELTLEGGYHLLLLIEDSRGWANLCRLISLAHHVEPGKARAALPIAALADHAEGLICLSGCRKGEIVAQMLARRPEEALACGEKYARLFGRDHFWIELQNHLLPDDQGLVADLVELAGHLGVGVVATNNVHYAARDGHRLQDVLVCIQHRTTLDESAHLRRPNSEYYLKSAEEMAALFLDYPKALTNTHRIAARCNFELRYGVQDLPDFPTPNVLSPIHYLRHLCRQAISRQPSVLSQTPSAIQERLAHELGVIERAGLANYFLIVWDIVRFAREKGIRCQGRGSAANSLVAYLLGITPVDPLAHDLVFERFLSDERAMAPDIDIDFQADRREEVIQYVYQRYGPEHTAMACTLVTFRARSAMRDVGKALGFPLGLLDRAAKALDTREAGAIADSTGFMETFGDKSGYLPWQQLLDLCRQLDPSTSPSTGSGHRSGRGGFPRHLGIHNGGMIITGAPVVEIVPTEPATMPDRVVTQWDKESLEDVGLVKIDLLGLRVLSAIAEALETIKETVGEQPDLDHLLLDDPAVYELIASGNTIGVFQVESRAQAQMLPKLNPRNFEDLIVEISLVRPGPIQGDMVHPYLRRRQGREAVTYPHPLLEAALAETLGVIIFQEQVLKVARDLAGFTPGQAELLRRAMGKKHGTQEIERFREAFLAGARTKGVSLPIAEQVFEQLRAFGGYSFPKSHAASFAVLVYQSAWLKQYHPLAWYAAILNNQPTGFWSPAVVVNDAKRHGVRILPVDINDSQAKCTVENGSIRLGFRYVEGLGEASLARLEGARRAGAFEGLSDFCRRTKLPRRTIENLILVGAMDGWGIPRRKLLWDLGKLRYHEEELDLVLPDACTEPGRSDGGELPPLSQAEKMGAEYGVLGLSTGDHVMALYRPLLKKMGILSSLELENRKDREKVKVAGLVVVRQAPPTAKGHVFVTLEDEYDLVNVIVRPDVYQRFRHSLRNAPLIAIEGVLQRRDGVVSLLAQRAVALTRQ